MSYVQVAVNLPLESGIFDYHLPPELEGQALPGCLVVVPFGKQEVQAILLRQVEVPQVAETRQVLALLDPQRALTPYQINLAEWLSREYLAPLAECIHLMLPPGLSQVADTLYSPVEPPPGNPALLAPLARQILGLLAKRGPLRGRQIENGLPRMEWRPTAQKLALSGWLLTQPVLPPPGVRPKVVRTAQLAASLKELENIQLPGRDVTHPRRRAILAFLQKEANPVPVQWVYATSGGKLGDLEALAETGLLLLGETELWRDPLADLPQEVYAAPPLTPDQQQVWQIVLNALQNTQPGTSLPPVLLQGVTGSGKTEIYLRAVEETLRQGRQAVVLVPEISLTPQTLRRFTGRFPGQVGLVHSRLSAGERYDTWRRARMGRLPVILGPRSALFTPLPNLGLVVVDEFDDDSYTQSDFRPAYSAVQTAIEYCRLAGAVCLLGSATPDISLLHTARRENWPVLGLPLRILAHRKVVESQLARLGRKIPVEVDEITASLPLPPVEVVDMRLELQAGSRSIFSRSLQQALSQVLAQDGQQAILFLNRRGLATYVFCRECGNSLMCPRCDRPLTYHGDQPGLLCHTCGYRRQMPEKCPKCHSSQIRQFGTGTEKVESELLSLFPQVRALRWDAGSVKQKDSHELILSHFTGGRADVLIGTQMLAKSLDLPRVTLVGIVLADAGLNFPDFRASERTFQLLTQVAGRAGRSPLGGRVVLQTFQPEHPAVRFAAKHDFESYAAWELAQRKQMGYPPFSRLVRMEYRHMDAVKAEAEAQRMAGQLDEWINSGGFSATERIGPVPCYFAREAGQYRWQIVLRGPDPAVILRGRVPQNWLVQVDPVSLL